MRKDFTVRNFKIGIWIFCALLIQTVIVSQIHIFGAGASLIAGYIVCVTVLENEFRNALTITVIAAALTGALSGRGFEAVTLFYAYSAVIIFALRKKPRYVGAFPKALAWTFICSGLVETVLFFIDRRTLTSDMLLYAALPAAAVNTALAALIYPLLKKTMYKEEKEKLLIV